nr:translation initiation factor IF-2-like [Anser cygnoides]
MNEPVYLFRSARGEPCATAPRAAQQARKGGAQQHEQVSPFSSTLTLSRALLQIYFKQPRYRRQPLLLPDAGLGSAGALRLYPSGHRLLAAPQSPARHRDHRDHRDRRPRLANGRRAPVTAGEERQGRRRGPPEHHLLRRRRRGGGGEGGGGGRPGGAGSGTARHGSQRAGPRGVNAPPPLPLAARLLGDPPTARPAPPGRGRAMAAPEGASRRDRRGCVCPPPGPGRRPPSQAPGPGRPFAECSPLPLAACCCALSPRLMSAAAHKSVRAPRRDVLFFWRARNRISDFIVDLKSCSVLSQAKADLSNEGSQQ